MPKPKFTQEQIAYTHKQAEGGTAVTEVCRKVVITEQTFYRWKRKFAGMGVAELRRLKQLEEENKKLKPLVADLTLDKHATELVPNGADPGVFQRKTAEKEARQSGFCNSSRGRCCKSVDK